MAPATPDIWLILPNSTERQQGSLSSATCTTTVQDMLSVMIINLTRWLQIYSGVHVNNQYKQLQEDSLADEICLNPTVQYLLYVGTAPSTVAVLKLQKWPINSVQVADKV